MTLTESKLSLDPDGDDFVLTRKAEDGTVTSMKLSETDILTLTQSVPALQQQVLSRHNRNASDYTAVSATQVVQMALNDEALKEAILLTMIGPGGSRATFALPPHIAELLVQRLPVFLARIAAAKPTKQ